MAMLAGSVLPMLMQPEVRKGMSKLVKYLLIFGTMGVGILAFVLISKKINPLKSIGGWLKKNYFSNPLGLIGTALGTPTFETIGKDLQKGAVGFQKDVHRGVTGFQKDIQRGASGFGKDVARGWTGFWSDIGKGVAGFQKDVAGKLKLQGQKRRQLRRVSKPIVRELGVLAKQKGVVSLSMAKRMSTVKSSFRKVKKKPVKSLSKQFTSTFVRKQVVQTGAKAKLIADLIRKTKANDLGRTYNIRNRARIQLRRLGVTKW